MKLILTFSADPYTGLLSYWDTDARRTEGMSQGERALDLVCTEEQTDLVRRALTRVEPRPHGAG